MTEEGTVSANTTESIGWRVGALFAIMLCGALGSMLPALLTKFTKLTSTHNAFLIGKAFGTGVVLATAYIHIMPDAGEDIKEGLNDLDYPLSSLLAFAATIVVMIIEQLANDAFSSLAGSGKTRVIAYLLEFGIAVHSVIIGLALGCQTDVGEIRALMIALCFHQAFEGFALGASVVSAKLSLVKNIIMIAIFSTTTPIGIGIGIGITQAQNEDSPTLHLTQGVLDSISFGILIYMALVDMLSEDIAFIKNARKSKTLKYCFILAFAAGGGVMALLGIWA